METIAGLIQSGIDWAIGLWPMTVIPDNELGVRYTLGISHRQDLEAGLRFYMPIIQSIETIDATLGPLSLGPQSLQTQDGKDITLVGSLIYQVVNAREYLLRVNDGDSLETVRTMGRQAVYNYVAGATLEQLRNQEHREVMNGQILSDLESRIDNFGISIQDFGIEEMTRARALRLINGDYYNSGDDE